MTKGQGWLLISAVCNVWAGVAPHPLVAIGAGLSAVGFFVLAVIEFVRESES